MQNNIINDNDYIRELEGINATSSKVIKNVSRASNYKDNKKIKKEKDVEKENVRKNEPISQVLSVNADKIIEEKPNVFAMPKTQILKIQEIEEVEEKANKENIQQLYEFEKMQVEQKRKDKKIAAKVENVKTEEKEEKKEKRKNKKAKKTIFERLQTNISVTIFAIETSFSNRVKIVKKTFAKIKYTLIEKPKEEKLERKRIKEENERRIFEEKEKARLIEEQRQKEIQEKLEKEKIIQEEKVRKRKEKEEAKKLKEIERQIKEKEKQVQMLENLKQMNFNKINKKDYVSEKDIDLKKSGIEDFKDEKIKYYEQELMLQNQRIERKQKYALEIAKARKQQDLLEQLVVEEEQKEQERLEAIRLEEERKERERLEALRLEEERKERERLEALRLEEERKERERLEALRLEEERKERERLEAIRLEEERKERERLEAIRLEEERKERERLEAIRLEEERKEQERLEAIRLEEERKERERLEALRLEEERKEQERLEAIRLEEERKEQERLEAIRLEEEHKERLKARQELLKKENEELEILDNEVKKYDELIRNNIDYVKERNKKVQKVDKVKNKKTRKNNIAVAVAKLFARKTNQPVESDIKVKIPTTEESIKYYDEIILREINEANSKFENVNKLDLKEVEKSTQEVQISNEVSQSQLEFDIENEIKKYDEIIHKECKVISPSELEFQKNYEKVFKENKEQQIEPTESFEEFINNSNEEITKYENIIDQERNRIRKENLVEKPKKKLTLKLAISTLVQLPLMLVISAKAAGENAVTVFNPTKRIAKQLDKLEKQVNKTELEIIKNPSKAERPIKKIRNNIRKETAESKEIVQEEFNNKIAAIKQLGIRTRRNILGTFNRIKPNRISRNPLGFNSKNGKLTLSVDSNMIKMIILVLLVVLMFRSVWAWFYNEYISKGTMFGIGNIDCVVKQYDSNGVFLNEFNDTSTIIQEQNLSNMSKNSTYIEIENVGTLDVEYNMVFQLDGTTSNIGVMYYRLYDVTDEVNASVISAPGQTKLQSYAKNNPIPTDMEFDTTRPVQNMTTIKNLIQNGTIELDTTVQDNNKKYYRLDYGMYSNANSALYAGTSFSLHSNVYVSQVGSGLQNDSEGEVWGVENEQQFRNAAANALPGDIIKLMNDIKIEGSIDIARRIHLDLNDWNLEVTGDLVYDFVELGELSIKVTGNSTLEVGNDLYINTPKSQVHITGENSVYDIYAGGKVTVNGIQNEEDDGVLLENVRIVSNKIANIPADIYVMSNTRLTIGPGVVLGNVIAESGSTNIEILNNGTIVQILLDQMNLLESFSKPQIYIYNLNTIRGIVDGKSIVLPSNASPYKGANNGNTLIVKGASSSDITVGGSDLFGQGDISYEDVEASVIPIEGEENAYIVYIREVNATTQGLLEEYFRLKGSENVSADIAKIQKLIFYTVNAQYFENDDFDYLKSSALPKLQYLSLENARVIDDTTINRIASNALANKTSIKYLLLPKTVEEIGSGAFQGITLGSIPATVEDFKFLTIPETVEKIESNAFTQAKYISFEGIVIPEIETNAFSSTSKLFVDYSIMDAFGQIPAIDSNNVHRKATLDDSGLYFIYLTANGAGISLYTTTINVGSTLTIPNTVTQLNRQYKIAELGVSSFRNIETAEGGADLVLPVTVTSIDKYAFYNIQIRSVNFDNVTNIGDYAFTNSIITRIVANNLQTIGTSAFENAPIQYLELENIKTIGASAFANNTSLYEAKLGYVSNIGNRAFYNCEQLGRVYFKNQTTKLINNGESIDLNIGTESVFSNWGKFLDGRLRIYVPDGTSDTGTTYLSLYKKLFGEEAERYIFTTGEVIGSYNHVAIPYDFGEYTVKEVTVLNKDGNPVNGYEIISYQGMDLGTSYNIPSTLTVNDVTKPVVSIGEQAYINANSVENAIVDINQNNIITIGKKAFYEVTINSVTSSSVEIIGEEVFYDSGVTFVKFDRLSSIGDLAFSNNEYLYSMDLGNVKTIGKNAIQNTPNLEQLFLRNADVDNMVISTSNFTSIGGNTKNRLRIYIPDTVKAQNYYSALFKDYTEFIYPIGEIVGSFINAPLPYDIGEYSIREVTLKDSFDRDVVGWEIIEYHGADLEAGYQFPTSYTVGSKTYDVISIGERAYKHTITTSGLDANLTNDKLMNIGEYAFNGTKGIGKIELTALRTLGAYAFEGSTITEARFENLYSIGTYALANIQTLYLIDLGTVVEMSEYAVYNLNKLSVVYFEATNASLLIDVRSIMNVGSLTNNRIRFYVTDGTSPSGVTYVDMYKNLFAEDIRPFFYPKGYKIGSYTQNNIPLDIGSYTVRNITKKDKNGNNITGAELIEYHGENLDSIFEIPETVNIDGVSKDLISIGDSAFLNTVVEAGSTFEIINDKLLYVGKNVFADMRGVLTLIADELVEVGAYSFYNNKLTDVSLKGIKVIGDYAFAENPTINYIYLGKVESIGEGAFVNDTGVEQFYMETTSANATAGKVNITIGANAFQNLGSQVGDRLRIYVPDGQISAIYTYVDGYKNILPEQIKNYVFPTGSIIGSYVLSPFPRDIGEYSVRQVSKKKADGTSVIGWEIIEYHGADITDYQLPKTLTVNSTTLDVISVGPYAYTFAEMADTTFNYSINSDKLLFIGKYAYAELGGVSEVIADNVATIEEHALVGNKIVQASFKSLTSLGDYALANNQELNYLHLGNVATIGESALQNDTGLEQLFFTLTSGNAASGRINIQIGTNAFDNIATTIGDRFRIYVPDGKLSDTYTYTDAYKNVLPESIAKYTFPTGYIIGSYVHSPLQYDIGQYSVRQVEFTKANGTKTSGWELVEYHGTDLTSTYTLPTEITANGITQPLISIGDYAYKYTMSLNNQTWPLRLPNAVVNIGAHAFEELMVSSVTGSYLVSIGDYAFANTSYLTSAIFDGIQRIGEYAFYYTTRLATMTIGVDIEYIGNYAFQRPYNSNDAYLTIKINALVAPQLGGTTAATMWPGSQRVIFWTQYKHQIQVPTNATGYSGGAWANVTTVTYAGSFEAEVVGNYAKIKSYSGNGTLTIPDELTIEDQVYQVGEIAANAFDSSTITSLGLPRYLYKVDDGFLQGNSTIRTITVNANNKYFTANGGVLFSKNQEMLIKYPNAKTGNSYTIPNTVTSLGIASFSGNLNLQTLVFPASVVAIAPGSFTDVNITTYDMRNLTKPPVLLGSSMFPVVQDLKILVGSNALVTTFSGTTYYSEYSDYISRN